MEVSRRPWGVSYFTGEHRFEKDNCVFRIVSLRYCLQTTMKGVQGTQAHGEISI